ncbi:hypothetical protein HYPSUDRAFT_1027578 [Hypholoma sublateritium FD-334 SS-4]|uniref:Uncharacterized protein n=1 Tax=Hypholoma sublateritium (strain FD-334 SS-4) TaxID=945553 RepID=A0A0D2KRQ0_HYPSF|nr:hypothetical protein HYPSUDRAFT_1027578 [Hypholoma sublateritium FD-334 SS-4]
MHQPPPPFHLSHSAARSPARREAALHQQAAHPHLLIPDALTTSASASVLRAFPRACIAQRVPHTLRIPHTVHRLGRCGRLYASNRARPLLILFADPPLSGAAWTGAILRLPAGRSALRAFARVSARPAQDCLNCNCPRARPAPPPGERRFCRAYYPIFIFYN